MKASSSKSEVELSWVWCVSHFFTAKGGVICSWSLANRHTHPISFLHVSSLSRWGPRAGWPAFQWPHRPSLLVNGFLPGPFVTGTGIGFVMLVSCSGGPSTPYSDTCRILIRWNIVSWIKPNHYTAKISLKSPGHILEHHLWNMLVNKSILAFIPHFGPF